MKRALVSVGVALVVAGGVIACSSDGTTSSSSSGGSSSSSSGGSSSSSSSGGSSSSSSGGSSSGDAGADGGGGKAFGETCASDGECKSNACFKGGQGSYCSAKCTMTGVNDPVCQAITGATGKCNNQGYCQK